jgi:DNA-binding transcriptional ArsR family regulator
VATTVDLSRAAQLFHALSDDTRLAILDMLRNGERCVCDLMADLDAAQSRLSFHLRVLREAGLVTVRQDAQRRWYELSAEPLGEVDAWLEPYRALWADRLDALEGHLDRKEQG